MKRLFGTFFMVSFFGGLLVGLFFLFPSKPFYSVELGVAEPSFLGFVGGFVTPASCPSYAHTPGECDGWSGGGASGDGSGGGGGGGSGGGGGVSSAPPSFSCSASSILLGEAVTCSWSCPSGNTSSGGIGFSTGGAPSGSVSVVPTASATFGVQCFSSGAQTTFQVTTLVPLLSISADPIRVRSGNASTISWSAANVTSCTVSGPGVNTSCSGASCAAAHTAATGPLTAQSTYTLTCQAPSGARFATARVSITPRLCEVGTVDCPE